MTVTLISTFMIMSSCVSVLAMAVCLLDAWTEPEPEMDKIVFFTGDELAVCGQGDSGKDQQNQAHK